MRLTGGHCSACNDLTSTTVLWCGVLETSSNGEFDGQMVRVWCCDACASSMGEDVRAQLSLAARDLALRWQRAELAAEHAEGIAAQCFDEAKLN